MRLIAFLTEPASIRALLAHLGEPTTTPALAPRARDPPELDAAELPVLRVTQRAIEGGHDVPLDKLYERFPRTLRNLAAALRFVGVALC
jgi:hypothetical protein